MRLWGRRDLRQLCRQREAGCRTRLHTGMDARRSRLPEKPVNIGFTAQKARKQGDGPPARGTRSPNKGNGTRRQPKKPTHRRWLKKRQLQHRRLISRLNKTSEKQLSELLARILRPHKGFADKKRIHITLPHRGNILTTKNTALRHQQTVGRYLVEQTKRRL